MKDKNGQFNCRHCNARLELNLIDLGHCAPSNSYVASGKMQSPEINFPLVVKVCQECWLVQTEDYHGGADLFEDDYAYLSSISSSWLKHSSEYCSMIINRLRLNEDSFVVEVASNDGYLLQYFNENNIRNLGVEPTLRAAEIAREKGINVVSEFFGKSTAEELVEHYGHADLVIGNNVYAHVPDINNFTLGLSRLLSAKGTITLEFPHLLSLMKFTQFDTIYHEHYSYLSLNAVSKIFTHAGLKIYDVEKITTHGGSIRIYGTHQSNEIETSPRVSDLIEEEVTFGLTQSETYGKFQERVLEQKYRWLLMLLKFKEQKKKVFGYGAAAKGNTLLNFFGIRSDLISGIYDAAESKQEKFTPTSHIPIKSPSCINHDNPDIFIVFPWNIYDEIANELEREYGVKRENILAANKF